MEIYTITCSNAYNYGAVLQAYALQSYLEDLGNEVKIIDYFPPYLRKISEKNRKNYWLRCVRFILYFPDYHKSKKVFFDFKKKYLKTTTPCFSKLDIAELDKADLYIVGSDQVWNPNMENGRDENYFLNIKNINKMSYAASIACEDIDKKYYPVFHEFLKDYLKITVREKQTINLLNKIGLECDCVLDPVYLLSREKWKSLCTETFTEKYILVYALHHIQEIYDYAKILAEKLKIKMFVVNVEIKEKRRGGDKFFWNPNVNSFLSLINNAEGIVTNSFHGVSFGLIFNKPIHLFDTEKNDLRIKNIIDTFNLTSRVIPRGSTNLLENNASSIERIMKKEKEKSQSILISTLNEVSGTR